MRPIKQSEATAARRLIYFRLIDSADHLTPKTGVTLSAGDLKVSKAGGAKANHAGTWAELAGGEYTYTPTTGEVDTLGEATFSLIKTGIDPVARLVLVVPHDPFDAVRLGLSALPNAAAGAAGGLPTLSQLATAIAAANRMGRRVIYVAPAGGNDGNDGLHDPANAKATWGSANTAAADGDCVFLLPDLTGAGARHAVSSSLTLKAGVTYLGMGPHQSRVQFTGSAVLNLPNRYLLGGIELDGSASTAATGLLYRNSAGDDSGFGQLVGLKVIAKLSAFQYGTFASANKTMVDRCDFIAGASTLNCQGAPTNVLRVFNSLIGGSNALNGSDGNVACLSASQGQIDIVNSALQAICFSSDTDQVNAILGVSQGILDIRMTGGSLKTLNAEEVDPDPIHRIVRVDGTGGTNTRIMLAGVACDDDPTLIEASGGAIVEQSAGGGTAQAVWDLFSEQPVGKKPDGSDLTWREAQVYLPAFAAGSHRRTSQGKTEILSGDGSQVAAVGTASLDARTLEELRDIYPLDE
jgi:hypothetical protein